MRVEIMAIVMPKMPIIFPCLAVLGEANPLIEKIKNMLAFENGIC